MPRAIVFSIVKVCLFHDNLLAIADINAAETLSLPLKGGSCEATAGEVEDSLSLPLKGGSGDGRGFYTCNGRVNLGDAGVIVLGYVGVLEELPARAGVGGGPLVDGGIELGRGAHVVL